MAGLRANGRRIANIAATPEYTVRFGLALLFPDILL
jgi:hypothetical protein